jgi:hypothetical protein
MLLVYASPLTPYLGGAASNCSRHIAVEHPGIKLAGIAWLFENTARRIAIRNILISEGVK